MSHACIIIHVGSVDGCNLPSLIVTKTAIATSIPTITLLIITPITQ